jgi:hypothetical protein
LCPLKYEKYLFLTGKRDNGQRAQPMFHSGIYGIVYGESISTDEKT